MSLAEIICRGTSLVVSLMLFTSLGQRNFGRIDFPFTIVFWLVLIVRDTFEGIVVRELALHPRLVRPLVNHVLAVKGLLAVVFFGALGLVGSLTFSSAEDRALLTLYGLLLLTTALGLDFVYRGTERMGIVAISLCIRTVMYAGGVWILVNDASQILCVPASLALGEACGISLVWVSYWRRYGLPRPTFGVRFLRVFLRRGRSVCLIQLAQTFIGSSDLLVVGLMTDPADYGCYSATYRLIAVFLTFSLIFQQVMFPLLARSWRQSAVAGRATLNGLIQILTMGLIPVAVGAAVLSAPLIHFLLPHASARAGLLLAVGIWRAPLLTLAYLYQTTLIAANRESAGARLLMAGAISSGPLVAISCRIFGLPGATVTVLLIALGLVLAGYACLAREGRQPAWHHHLARPLLAATAMVPVCLLLQPWHVALAVMGGAATYLLVLAALGGLRLSQLRAILLPNRSPS
jgi:O-antigen/teichoic acid export membrane protein